jgi:hypothetical protein
MPNSPGGKESTLALDRIREPKRGPTRRKPSGYRPDDFRSVQPELDGPGEWIMAYNKPTSLRVPLSSVME